MMKQVCENGEKIAMKMLLPSNYFRNGRRSVDEDDHSERKETLLLKEKLQRSKQNSSFPCK
jgi:hypothetical protein